MDRHTALVLTLNTKTLSKGSQLLGFVADYSDPANKDWAAFTPNANLNMTVTDEVGDNFELGATYLFTAVRRG